MDDDSEQNGEISQELAELLQSKGTIEILVELGEEPQRHTDLREQIPISSATLQARLNKGKEYGVWEQKLIDKNENAVKVYDLTEYGEILYEILQASAKAEEKYESAHTYYQKRRDINQHIERIERRFIIHVSPENVDWLEEIGLEDHSFQDRQTFLSEHEYGLRNMLQNQDDDTND